MRRWQRVYMDFAVFEGQNLLVLQDGHSKWPEDKILTHTDTSLLIQTLRTFFAAYGLPQEVVSLHRNSWRIFSSGMQLPTPSHQRITPRVTVR
jgi:hypothetical protein